MGEEKSSLGEDGGLAPPDGLQLSILLLGDIRREEFRDARKPMDRWGRVHEFVEVDEAVVALSEGRIIPDVIVVAQAFAGQYSHATIDRLRRLAPLARVIGLLGSWCEGEMRSGSPWPAALRSYWHQWPLRADRQFRRLAEGRHCSWALPSTATDEERLLADAAHCFSRRQGLIAIRAGCRVLADWYSAAFRSRGFATVWERPGVALEADGASAAIFDAARFDSDEEEQMRQFSTRLCPAPVLAVLNFPRADDRRRALAAGAARILSKPVSLDDLYCALDDCLDSDAKSSKNLG